MIIYNIRKHCQTTLIFINHLKRASFYLSVENSLKKTLISISKVEQPISFKQIIRRLCITSTYTFLFELYFNFLMKNKVFHLISTTLSYQHNIHFHINIIYKKDYVLAPSFLLSFFFFFIFMNRKICYFKAYLSFISFFSFLFKMLFFIWRQMYVYTKKKHLWHINLLMVTKTRKNKNLKFFRFFF